MKQVLVLLACILAVNAIEWIDFVDETGAIYNSQAQEEQQNVGEEMSLAFGPKAGGHGGGQKILTCERKGGIRQICVRTGNIYIGHIRLTCNNNHVSTCGLGLGHGAGGSWDCYSPGERFIYAVDVVVANNYVKSIKLRGGDYVLKTFGPGRSGKTIRTGTVKNVLLGLKLRCGHWIDAVQGGFGSAIERPDHKCTKAHGKHNQCNGGRCCSKWNWCGGYRDGHYEAWCGHDLLSSFNHIAGFSANYEDISVGLTSAFAAVIVLPFFAAFKLYQKRVENTQEYQNLLLTHEQV